MSNRFAALSAAFVLVAVSFIQSVVVASPASAVPAFRVLITGDSITQGSSGDYTWRYRLWNKLADTAPGNVSFVGTRTDLYDNVNDAFGSQYYAASFSAKAHSAVWGDTFINELPKIASEVSTSDANTLVVMLGSNDLSFWTSPADTIANLRTYIANARAAKPGLDVVVGEVVNKYDPWADSYNLVAEGNDYAARLQTMASELNTTSERVVIAPTRTGWDAKIHTWDGTHPNPTGEALIAQRISQGLAQIGIGTSSPDVTGNLNWNVTAPGVSVTSGSEQAQLGWSRTSTGATGFFIEVRLVNNNGAWQRLPYPIGGNGWTSTGLAAGGTYQFRIVPAKIWNTGLAGPATSTTVTGPTPGSIASVSVSAGGDSSWGGKEANASWSSATNAQGYILSSRLMSNGTLVWDDLPYPVSTLSWTFGMLPPGRYHQFRIQPVRGFLSGPWASSSTTRIHGLPGDRVYVALGDSYSSGLGSSGEYDAGCHRASNAWAFQLQPAFQSATSLRACAGDTISGVRGQMSSMNSYFAARTSKPQLITLTVGGNDVGFVDTLNHCVTGSCASDESEIWNRIDSVESSLRSLYNDIQAAQPYSDLVVGGYPWVVEPGGTSGNALCDRLGANERDMVARLSTHMNDTIASAAHSAGAWTVGNSVRSQFVGHNACVNGIDEWIHAGNLDIGGTNGFIDAKSFHPKDSGQVAYAIAFSNTLINLSQ